MKAAEVKDALMQFETALTLNPNPIEAQVALYDKACCHAYRFGDFKQPLVSRHKSQSLAKMSTKDFKMPNTNPIRFRSQSVKEGHQISDLILRHPQPKEKYVFLTKWRLPMIKPVLTLIRSTRIQNPNFIYYLLYCDKVINYVKIVNHIYLFIDQ